jgi:hypothetical protein
VSATNPNEVAEVLQTLDRLHAALADLVVRGLRSAGPAQLAPLEALREEFGRIGAEHLAGRLGDLFDAVRNDDRGAAAALLRAQTSSRLFERLLTVEHAQGLLAALLPDGEEAP